MKALYMHYLIESLKQFYEVESFLHFTHKKTETIESYTPSGLWNLN